MGRVRREGWPPSCRAARALFTSVASSAYIPAAHISTRLWRVTIVLDRLNFKTRPINAKIFDSFSLPDKDQIQGVYISVSSARSTRLKENLESTNFVMLHTFDNICIIFTTIIIYENVASTMMDDLGSRGLPRTDQQTAD